MRIPSLSDTIEYPHTAVVCAHACYQYVIHRSTGKDVGSFWFTYTMRGFYELNNEQKIYVAKK